MKFESGVGKAVCGPRRISRLAVKVRGVFHRDPTRSPRVHRPAKFLASNPRPFLPHT
jgi:hypothetical protein